MIKDNTSSKDNQVKVRSPFPRSAQPSQNFTFTSSFSRHKKKKEAKLPPEQQKCQSKFLDESLALAMVNENPTSPLKKSYWNLYHCNSIRSVNAEGNWTGKYCKTRICSTCNRIRSAQLHNGYGDQLTDFVEPHFITLTLPTVFDCDIKERIDQLIKGFRNIRNNINRSKFFPEAIKGIRKLEITLRPEGKYHVHLHAIVEGKAQSEQIIKSWLKMFPQANALAQKAIPANENVLKELFKYVTKTFVSDSTRSESGLSNYVRLDAVMQNLRNRQIFSPFGGVKLISEDIEEELVASTPPEGSLGQIWTWYYPLLTWVSEYGEIYCEYKPSHEILHRMRSVLKYRKEPPS